eukprot:CAMPEP_0113311624 /NCGR_PEP_ID=MMETSP0010_2-20120614/8783_1 /TAXON_ID=216773 ORGANISM="Corethron hystrix, Strain 308" /NCGR_SAMPLE_ID=MMETSP0010_2 /ASSEMBLY_ACC=CAM_ASM_000155 /LENGTH=194 /DNA_ID=CAMNT_0000167293 /DNA_START=203 /DNA_END=787 /DNA_ORIENTATION=+ /assembly_acc=CAM_ASM_000155
MKDQLRATYSRRSIFVRTSSTFAISFFSSILNPAGAIVDEVLSKKSTISSIVRGTVTISPGDTLPMSATSALYVTARPDRSDNVPRAILDGSSGKPPPVAAARFSGPIDFPFRFELTDEDCTAEGTAMLEGRSERWWEGLDMIVSARLDSDGVAQTRDPEDLVGRGVYKNREDVEVKLQGRGFGGKFVTKKVLK